MMNDLEESSNDWVIFHLATFVETPRSGNNPLVNIEKNDGKSGFSVRKESINDPCSIAVLVYWR